MIGEHRLALDRASSEPKVPHQPPGELSGDILMESEVIPGKGAIGDILQGLRVRKTKAIFIGKREEGFIEILRFARFEQQRVVRSPHDRKTTRMIVVDVVGHFDSFANRSRHSAIGSLREFTVAKAVKDKRAIFRFRGLGLCVGSGSSRLSLSTCVPPLIKGDYADFIQLQFTADPTNRSGPKGCLNRPRYVLDER